MPEIFAGSAAYLEASTRGGATARPVLTIGNFDGLHLGHRHLLRQLKTLAEEHHAPTVVYTFDPPPRVVLAPHQHQARILAWPDKVRLLGELGVDQVIVERFTRPFAQHPPQWFAREVLGRRICPQALMLGYDFRFGRARQGDIDTLRALLPGTPIQEAEVFKLDGLTVSSSSIRASVLAGEVAVAASRMGRVYSLRGTVVLGDQRGRTIGFPTANLSTDSEMMPAVGVYAVWARVDGGEPHMAVANLGTRPTFEGEHFSVEIHLLNFSGDLYGRELDVGFVQRLRGEIAFQNVDSLVAQIRVDIDAAKPILAAHR